MRKILPLLFCLLSIQMLNAQTCTPNWPFGNTYGMTPDTVQNLPAATVGVLYNTAINFRVKPDTSEFGVPVTINYVLVDSVHGLPSFLSYKCNPSDCKFKGDSIGCVDVYGTPPTSSEALYKIVVYVNVNLTIPLVGTQNVTETFSGYHIQVDWPTAVTEIPSSEVFVSPAAPNPANTETIVNLFATHPENIEYMLFDLTGRRVFEQNLASVSGEQNIHIPTASLPAGTYIIYLQTPQGSYKAPLVVTHY